MTRSKAQATRSLSDAAIVARVQSILINAAEGRRSISDDTQYPALRKQIARRRLGSLPLLQTHPTIDSFAAYINGIPDTRARIAWLREQIEPLLRSLEDRDGSIESSSWGAPSRAGRLKIVRELLPLAREAVESMIGVLSEPGPNGGPLLDGREEAVQHLRDLHRSLGELLTAVDSGHFEDELGEGLAAEVARYGKRAARALRDDPVPYAFSTLLLGMLHAVGFGGIGGHLSGMALAMRKHRGNQGD